MKKINSVIFKNKQSFEKNRKKENVLEVHKPFGIIIFEDEEEIIPNASKVRNVNEVESNLNEIPTGLILLIAKDYFTAGDFLQNYGFEIVNSFKITNTFIIRQPDFKDYDEIYEILMSSDLFVSIEQDVIRKEKKDSVNDFYAYTSQWHLPSLKALEAWAHLPEGVTGDVAVLDVGCETTHEDMIGATNFNWDCVDNGPDVEPETDNEKHGTPCAGIIAARTNNNIGVSSIGNNRLRVQFLNIGYNISSNGNFVTSDSICTLAVNKAIENPKCLALSMSWGGGSARPAFQNALTIAKNQGRNGKGIPLFASAGNSNINGFTQTPASYPQVMAIGASTINNVRATFSNYGPKLFAAAPGTSIRTIDRTAKKGYTSSGSDDPRVENYTNFSGTSAACPVFAGVAACMLLVNPDLTELQLQELLKQSCRKVGGYSYNTLGWSNELGYGIINFELALLLAKGYAVPLPKPNLTGVITSPNTSVTGNNVNISYTVNTTIPNDPVRTITCKVYLSSTSTVNSNSILINTNDITIGEGIGSVQQNISYTIPPNITGTRYFVLRVDSENTLSEDNENDNSSFTIINIAAPTGNSNTDLSINITGYEWIIVNGSEACRIWYKFRNGGSTIINSFKCKVGFDGLQSLNWNNFQTLNPGSTITAGTAQKIIPTSYPATFSIEITEVNGATDINTSNNKSTIIINK